MDNKQFEAFFTTFSAATEAEQVSLMKHFMLTHSLDELLAWNQFLAAKSEKSLQKIIARGLTDDDKAWFKTQYAPFDELEKQLNARKAA